jgi:hypothetical protein
MSRRRKPGRPTKLDDAVAASILSDVAAGVPQEAAAHAAGIDTTTFYRWKKAGVAKPSSVFGKFARGLRAARAKAHTRLAKAYYIAAMKNPQAAQFWFTRREPREWMEPEQRLQLSGKRGQPIETHDVVAQALFAKLERMEKAALESGERPVPRLVEGKKAEKVGV